MIVFLCLADLTSCTNSAHWYLIGIFYPGLEDNEDEVTTVQSNTPGDVIVPAFTKHASDNDDVDVISVVEDEKPRASRESARSTKGNSNVVILTSDDESETLKKSIGCVFVLKGLPLWSRTSFSLTYYKITITSA